MGTFEKVVRGICDLAGRIVFASFVILFVVGGVHLLGYEAHCLFRWIVGS